MRAGAVRGARHGGGVEVPVWNGSQPAARTQPTAPTAATTAAATTSAAAAVAG